MDDKQEKAAAFRASPAGQAIERLMGEVAGAAQTLGLPQGAVASLIVSDLVARHVFSVAEANVLLDTLFDFEGGGELLAARLGVRRKELRNLAARLGVRREELRNLARRPKPDAVAVEVAPDAGRAIGRLMDEIEHAAKILGVAQGLLVTFAVDELIRRGLFGTDAAGMLLARLDDDDVFRAGEDGGTAPAPQLGDAPIELKYQAKMAELARYIDLRFNGGAKGAARQTGFVLLVFPFGEKEGRANFISNGADRADIIVLFREMIARFEGQPELTGRA